MFNRHQVIKKIKRLVLGKTESYIFHDTKLSFASGTRPVRRKYLSSTNDVVRNDVLQIYYFEKYFKPTDTLWDIGSHYGHYSIFAASVATGANQVFSFEPDADARSVQYKNIEFNKLQSKIKVLDLAVSSTDGPLFFHSQGGNSTSHIVNAGEKNSADIIEVQAKTVDALLSELPAPSLVKIDAEGAEIDILRHADKLLANPDIRFICELHPFAWESFGVTYTEFENILRKHNRTIELLDKQKNLADLPFYGTVLF